MNTITTAGLRLTEDEATELCIHHLRLAFTFYLSSAGSSVKENYNNLEGEIHRQCTARGATDWELNSMLAFIKEACAGDEES